MLKRVRYNQLKAKASLNEEEIAEMMRMQLLALLELHKDVLSEDHLKKVFHDWSQHPKDHSKLIRFILFNFKKNKKTNPSSIFFLYSYANKLPYRNLQTVTIHLANYLLKYFETIPSGIRTKLSSQLVLSRTRYTQREILKLFRRKFDQFSAPERNQLLGHLLDDPNIPVAYFYDFWHNHRADISKANYIRLNRLFVKKWWWLLWP